MMIRFLISVHLPLPQVRSCAALIAGRLAKLMSVRQTLPNANRSHKFIEMASSVVADGTDTAGAATGRGAGYSDIENLLIAKAYIAASEDPIKANYQTAASIMEKVHTNYIALCVEQTS
jgi:hypothetical protein